MKRRMPSIREIKFTSDRGGWIEVASRPCFSNQFVVYRSGKIVFDHPWSVPGQAYEELTSMLTARGIRPVWHISLRDAPVGTTRALEEVPLCGT